MIKLLLKMSKLQISKLKKKAELDNLINLMRTKINERNGEMKKWCRKDFEIGFLLGKGKYGSVYLAREKDSRYIIALKEMNVKILQEDEMLDQVEREIIIQSKLHHPNIIHMHTYFLSSTKIYLVLEHAAQGELYKLLKKQPECRFREGVAARYINQVASALIYIHSKNVIHRDIKPENVLLDMDGNVKISDFGWSILTSNKRRTLCGTLDYIAPEIVEDKAYTSSIDNWALGILCFELLAGFAPFQSESEQETLQKIVSIDISYPVTIPHPARDLISRLLKYNPRRRLPLDQVIKHVWILKFSNNQ